MTRERHDTVIIGGGQAGLAMSAILREHGREHIVLERGHVGGRWQAGSWDSLRFQFPNWSSQLPGYRYAGDDPDGFAHHSQILGMLERYAMSIDAPVLEHADVLELAVAEKGTGFDLSSTRGSVCWPAPAKRYLNDRPDIALQARRVVLATGPFQRPSIPPFAGEVSPSITQLDPTRYRDPGELPPGAVLVVGSGASGFQIADELLHHGRRVFLSVSPHRRVPRRLEGKDIYWWLDQMGRFNQTVDSLPGGQVPPATVVTGMNGGYDVDVRRLPDRGARLIGRVTAAAGQRITVAPGANQILDEADKTYRQFMAAASEFAGENLTQDAVPRPAAVSEIGSLDLAEENITTIIWATGYAYDLGWVKVPVLDQLGRPVQRRGVTQQPGLYFLGLNWMHTIKSGLLSGVGADAEYVADHMSRRPV